MRRQLVTGIVLIILAIGIKIFSLFPGAVEKYYSNGIYLVISKVQRFLFGWLPFSVGDIFYAAVVIYGLVGLYRLFKTIFRKKADKEYWMHIIRKWAILALWIYVLFNGLWGLNYNRRSIADQLKLKTDQIARGDLEEVMQQLVYRLNNLDSLAVVNRDSLKRKKYLFNGAIEAYHSLEKKDPIFDYNVSSVKPSLFSYLGNYLGYTGYYNPLSGEAQVNTTVPVFIQPFTTCHEIGHQLGYAKENEANFAGYLSARESADPAFQYSVYFDLYNYSRFFLYWQDSLQLKRLDSQLNTRVKQDFRELRAFFRRHENPVEMIIDKLYSQYLKANEQPLGRVTYNQVVVWLIAYYKKYKTI